MGFRTELLYGEGYVNAASVMGHEVFELQNTDILDTLSNTILKDTELGKKLVHLSAVLSEESEDEEMEQFLDQAYEDETIGESFFENVLREIYTITGKDIKYCLWLCDSKDDLRYSYGDYFDDGNVDNADIDEYEDSDIVLSDMGREGKLYGYEKEPYKYKL